jgi:hypothetical protein
MATEIIIKNDNGRQVEITVELENDQNWEEKCYQVDYRMRRSQVIDPHLLAFLPFRR